MITNIGQALGFTMVFWTLLLLVLWAVLGHRSRWVVAAAAVGDALIMAAYVYMETFA